MPTEGMETFTAQVIQFLIVNQGHNMKSILVLLSVFYSLNLAAEVRLDCSYKQFKFLLTANKEEDVSIEIFKGKNKISRCLYQVQSYEEGSQRAGMGDLLRIEKKSCQIIFDKIASELELIQKGFVKYSLETKKSYAYIIKNEQPLECLVK